jgi:hypothetical protein
MKFTNHTNKTHKEKRKYGKNLEIKVENSLLFIERRKNESSTSREHIPSVNYT